MTTDLVGIKDFRANVARYVKRARSGKARVFVMNRNQPLFEIRPFAEDEGLDALLVRVEKARKEIQAGKYKDQADLLKKYAL